MLFKCNLNFNLIIAGKLNYPGSIQLIILIKVLYDNRMIHLHSVAAIKRKIVITFHKNGKQAIRCTFIYGSVNFSNHFPLTLLLFKVYCGGYFDN